MIFNDGLYFCANNENCPLLEPISITVLLFIFLINKICSKDGMTLYFKNIRNNLGLNKILNIL